MMSVLGKQGVLDDYFILVWNPSIGRKHTNSHKNQVSCFRLVSLAIQYTPQPSKILQLVLVCNENNLLNLVLLISCD